MDPLSPALHSIFEIHCLKFIVDCFFAVGLIDRVVKNTCTEKYPIQHNYLPNDI